MSAGVVTSIPVTLDPSRVPAPLRNCPQWVVWRYERVDGVMKKLPYDPKTLKRSSSTNPSTWGTFEQAYAVLQRGRHSGIGFALSENDEFVGVDLDECITEAGTLVRSAQKIVDEFCSYTEVSPSGGGVKIFIVGSKPDGARCRSKKVEGFKEIEIYDRKRFFAFTGSHLPGTPLAVEPRQEQLEALCERLWPWRKGDAKTKLRLVGSSEGVETIDDDELIQQALAAKNGGAFARLWQGDTSGHGGDDSVADLALCSHLAFWTGGDGVRIDRLFRRSGLHREKWERSDYRQMTIQKAIEGCSEFYKPGRRQRSKAAGGDGSILIAPDEHRVIDEAVEALSKDDQVFQRGGLLVRIMREAIKTMGIARHGQSVTIQRIPVANLRDRLTRQATFHRVDKKGEEADAHPPAWLVAAIEARAEWPKIRPLVGVASAPILRPDGSICQEPGYDEATGVLMMPWQRFPAIADDVDIDDAQSALDLLFEVVQDFRFETEEHKAGWLAALLTPLARYAYDGPSPLFLIDANVRGAGKGLLAQTIGQIVQGCEMPVSSYSRDTEEMRKKITAIAIAGDRMVLLDNLDGAMGNDALDRALTTTRWKDRVLGRSEQVDLPLTTVWYATGNNVMVGADTARRIVHIRLDVLEERPELRRDFAHPDLVGWIKEHRPRLLAAALTILAAYCRGGRPHVDLEAFGSFEGWSDLVRQAVVWVGLPDPCQTRYRLAEVADTTAESLRQLFAAWREYDSGGDGLVLSHLIKALFPSQRDAAPQDDRSSAMRCAIEEFVGATPSKPPTARLLGSRLKQYRRRVIDGFYLEADTSQRRAGARWRLVAAMSGGGDEA